MKKEIDSVKTGPRKKRPIPGKGKKAKAERAGFGLPGLPSGVKKLLGPRPLIRFSHQAALKIFEGLGFKFEVRHFGESRLGLLRWPIAKPAPGTLPRRLLMVPGFGDTPLSWWTILAGLKPILRRQFDEVVLIDYPGFSGFLHEEAAFDSMDELLRVFREVVDTLKPEVLVGHSLGGWLAADYAIERPDAAIRQIILVDPGGIVPSEADRVVWRDLFNRALQSGSKHLLPHVFAKAPLLLPFFEEEFFSFLKSDEVRSFVASIEDRHLLNDRVGRIRADSIVLWGDQDTLNPVEWIDHWLGRLPADRKKMGILVRGSGHSPQVEKPGILIALFTQIFLGREPKNLALLPLWKVITG
jgi:pimeloyl-ACP methyl ester carboxylesterase